MILQLELLMMNAMNPVDPSRTRDYLSLFLPRDKPWIHLTVNQVLYDATG